MSNVNRLFALQFSSMTCQRDFPGCWSLQFIDEVVLVHLSEQYKNTKMTSLLAR